MGWYYLQEDKVSHTFPKCINSKVNIVVQLEFELAYYNVAVQYVSLYTMWNPPSLMSTQRSMSVQGKTNYVVLKDTWEG